MHSSFKHGVIVPGKRIDFDCKVAAVIGPDRMIDLIGVGVKDIDERTDGLIEQFEFSTVVQLELCT